MQELSSTQADIEKYEKQLTRDPESYVFAPLSQAYLAAGQIENALTTARQGVSLHPRYVAGQRALALACYAKGMEDECLLALEAVTAALPDELESQRIFAKLLVATGQINKAIKVYRTILDFYPDDECRLDLETLEYGANNASNQVVSAQPVTFADEFEDDDDEIIEDIEILDMDESDVLGESEFKNYEVPASSVTTVNHDPLSTATLAELYVQQGFHDKALTIYRAMSAEARADERIKSRIEELEAKETAPSAVTAVSVEHLATEIHEDVFSVPISGLADNALVTLEGWLENVRRVKACR